MEKRRNGEELIEEKKKKSLFFCQVRNKVQLNGFSSGLAILKEIIRLPHDHFKYIVMNENERKKITYKLMVRSMRLI